MLPELGTRGFAVAVAVLGYSLLLLGIGYLLGRHRRLLPWRRQFAEENLPAILRYVEETLGAVDLLHRQLETAPEHKLMLLARDLHVMAEELPATYYTVLTKSGDPFIFNSLPELREHFNEFVRQVESFVRAQRDATTFDRADMDQTVGRIRRLSRQISKQARRVALTR